MADQNQVPPSSIPPKVSPFAKPDGAAPVTPAAPGTPRPITVRLKPVVPAADAPPAAQVPTPLAGGSRVTARVSIPEIDSDSEDVSEAVTQMSTPLSANPRVTARVPIPEIDTAAPAAVKIAPAAAPTFPQATSPATVRLRPVVSQAASPAVTPAAAPLQPQHPPTPGSHPLPDGPKPPSGAQVQAAKSKTSRISLDSAIGVAPMSPMGEKSEPKTIRLKRPTDLAAPAAPKVSTTPIRQTSRIPDSALPSGEAGEAEPATVTQKKTLKIKRPGAKEDASVEAPGEAFPEGVQMTPISSTDVPENTESPVFTAISLVAAVAALFVVAAVMWCLAAQAVGPVANMNATASINGPELPWSGRISE